MMKKILIFLLFIPIFAFSGLNIIKVNKMLTQLKSAKELKFYNANRQIALTGKLHFTSMEDADIILFSDKKNSNKMTIVNSYKALRSNKNSIGAIYLKKGRTQIIFIKERLKSHKISLSSNFEQHLLSECQLNPLCLLSLIK